jgi:deoxyribose-phosphate aldolase
MNIVQNIMKMVDHSLLSPTLTDSELEQGCAIAANYHTASVCVKPCHVRRAAELLEGTDVVVGAVIGFPHGNSTTAIKAAEAEQVIADGAVEVDMVVNIGKVLSEDWVYVTKEILTLVSITKEHKALLKVIFENDLLPDDKYKIRLCKICSEAGVDFIKTSTGYNYVKGSDGKYSYQGATVHDLQLMRDYASPEVQVKAAGKSGTLEAVLRLREIGVTRTGTAQTESLYKDAVEAFGVTLSDLKLTNETKDSI